MKILVVDDEKLLVKGITFNLANEGYEVTAAYDGEAAVELAKKESFDLIILDLMMPVLSGTEACMKIREFSDVPIIMLTARSEDADKLMGFACGADDYVTKPFDPVEVQARVRSQLRRYTLLGARAGSEESGVYTVGNVSLNEETKRVTVDGETVTLTPLEYNILHLLIRSPGRIYSSAQIYEAVWNEDSLGAETSVAVHIRHLRQKIEINPSDPRYLKVVWGLGYKMEDGEK